ncbi:MAG: hypothetical protein LBN04_04800 [Oscillospiraceae bacterium]|jgi:membrane-bound ClpP family serine protease|nr:hypothetical protein [Oscillospiraceae bacterium]
MIDFLIGNLPILICVIAGLALLILEVFMPGFGVPGISGIVLLLTSAVLLWIEAGPLAALGLVVVIVALVALMLSITLKSASTGKLSKSPIILQEAERPEAGYVASEDMSIFIGRQGETRTVLRPSGIADFEGVRLNVVSDGMFIKQGAAVRIERVEGSRIVVRELEKDT